MKKFDLLFEKVINSLKNENENEKNKKQLGNLKKSSALFPEKNEFVNRIYNNLDEILSPWIKYPFETVYYRNMATENKDANREGPEKIIEIIPSNGENLSGRLYKKSIEKLKQFSKLYKRHFKWGDFDISYEELIEMIRKLEENPYYKLVNLYSNAEIGNSMSSPKVQEVFKFCEKLGVIPEWITFDYIKEREAELRKRKDKNEAKEREAEEIKKWAENMEITDEVRKKWFKSYGLENAWTDEDEKKYKMANALHEIDSKKHPELHSGISHSLNEKYYQSNFYCNCGFGHSVDVSY